MQLDGAKVLVTGGGSGIGLATARLLAEAGARVAICGRRREPLEEAAEDFGAIPIRADVTNETDVRHLVADAVHHMGGLDALVNNAAGGYFKPLLETEAEPFMDLLRLNVVSAMVVARECAKHFVDHGGGTIVNVGSTASNNGFPRGTAYAATKFALSAMTECWRAELRKHDIRVCQVNPSEVQTGFNKGGVDPTELNPTKLHSEDIAHVVKAMLELDDRGFITDATVWATNPR